MADDDAGLFPDDLIPTAVQLSLPVGYRIRALRRTDYDAGFLDVLRVLTEVGEISKADFEARYDWMRSQDGYYTLVVQDCSKGGPDDRRAVIVGTGTVVVERKFIHQLGSIGHIEDISVAKDQQGKKLGLRIIQALDHIAQHVGCYKSILDCNQQTEGFYVKCDFRRAGLQMSHYYDKK